MKGSMKIMNNLVFTITLIGSAQAFAMEAPPAPPSQQPLIPITPLTKLPGDIQRILYTETMDGGLYQTAHTLLALAQTSKQHRAYVNENMIAILESFHTAKALKLIDILRNKTFSLPVLSSTEIRNWYKAKDNLVQGLELLTCIRGKDRIIEAKDIKKRKVEEFLKLKNIALNYKTAQGTAILDVAVLTSQPDVVGILLRAGANPNIVDVNGETPLMNAKKIGAQDSMDLLLQNGANTKLRNRAGQTVDDISYSPSLAEMYKNLYPSDQGALDDVAFGSIAQHEGSPSKKRRN